MVAPKSEENEISRDRLAELLNEDLSREYQAIVAQAVAVGLPEYPLTKCGRHLNRCANT